MTCAFMCGHSAYYIIKYIIKHQEVIMRVLMMIFDFIRAYALITIWVSHTRQNTIIILIMFNSFVKPWLF